MVTRLSVSYFVLAHVHVNLILQKYMSFEFYPSSSLHQVDKYSLHGRRSTVYPFLRTRMSCESCDGCFTGQCSKTRDIYPPTRALQAIPVADPRPHCHGHHACPVSELLPVAVGPHHGVPGYD